MINRIENDGQINEEEICQLPTATETVIVQANTKPN